LHTAYGGKITLTEYKLNKNNVQLYLWLINIEQLQNLPQDIDE